tara:strand:+ start:832 stop:1143 length:312 start_codon:yes stop_codon:yes gene_type:complete
MADFWLFFVKKINYSSQRLVKYFSILFKNILNSSSSISKNSLNQIEIQKMKWELKHHQEELGAYVYKCNSFDGAFNFSNDVDFNELVKKIKEIQNFIDKKNKN